INNQKEVLVPQQQNEEAELNIPGRIRDKPHRQELQKHPSMEHAAAPEDLMEYTDRFVEFMEKFGKTYEDNAEMLRRFKIYEKHMREISELNKNGQSSAEFGENELSDWTDEEFRKTLLPLSFYKRVREEATFIRNDPPKLERAAPIPDFFDWRARNVVSPVKSQGKCGSCWAFAATATVEAAWAIAHGEMRNLSEQTLLDCDMQDNACDGGDEDKAFRYIHRNGLAYAADLPYVAHRQNTCDVNQNTTKIEVAYFLHPDEQSMIDWLLGFGPPAQPVTSNPGPRNMAFSLPKPQNVQLRSAKLSAIVLRMSIATLLAVTERETIIEFTQKNP
ncbi:papain family cysteine protease, partial [Teladorsagia circumcincta]